MKQKMTPQYRQFYSSNPWLSGLSYRPAVCLAANGFLSKEEIVLLLKNDRKAELMTLPNFGAKAMAEVIQWLGDALA